MVAFEPHGSAEDVRWRVERIRTTVVSALDLTVSGLERT